MNKDAIDRLCERIAVHMPATAEEVRAALEGERERSVKLRDEFQELLENAKCVLMCTVRHAALREAISRAEQVLASPEPRDPVALGER